MPRFAIPTVTLLLGALVASCAPLALVAQVGDNRFSDYDQGVRPPSEPNHLSPTPGRAPRPIGDYPGPAPRSGYEHAPPEGDFDRSANTYDNRYAAPQPDGNAQHDAPSVRNALATRPDDPASGADDLGGGAAVGEVDSPLRRSEESAAPRLLPPRAAPADRAAPGSKGRYGAVVTVAGSLAAVLGLFLLMAWATRRTMPASAGLLPDDAVEVLGRKPLPGNQLVMLVRCGSRLLLLWVSSTGVETLTEITEPDEVQSLLATCRHKTSAATGPSFRSLIDQIGREPHAPGFIDSATSSSSHQNQRQQLEGADA